MNEAKKILEIDGLTVGFRRDDEAISILHGIDLCIERGEIVALVGESGSGKSMMAKAVMDMLPSSRFFRTGCIRFLGDELTESNKKPFEQLRGRDICQIFQDPQVCLNPTMKIGDQLIEPSLVHQKYSREYAIKKALECLKLVKIPAPKEIFDLYPFECSGGVKQRIVIATALMQNPTLIIADEPTTALDCIAQKQVLEILRSLVDERNIGLLLITHDMNVVAKYADSMLVLKKGVVQEHGSVADVLGCPRSDYTKSLLESLPSVQHSRSSNDVGCQNKVVLSIENVTVSYKIKSVSFLMPSQSKIVLKNINLELREHQILAIVGQSGSGKSTLGKALLQLVELDSGLIRIDDYEIRPKCEPNYKALSARIQVVFQDPYTSLSPKLTVFEIVAEPLLISRHLPQSDINSMVVTMLCDVGLEPEYLNYYPVQLSGGQRQRVAIARALITRPKIVLADEPVSALDITIQAQVLNLLVGLRKKYGFSCIFITHDLSVVELIAQQVAVISEGAIVEKGPVGDVFSHPKDSYTKTLLGALPELDRQANGGYFLKQREFY